MGNTLSFRSARPAPRNVGNAVVQPPEPNNGCTFLDKLPLEVRRKIYKHLLVNPMLGESELAIYTCPQNSKETQHIQYGLSPSILYTNRQAYEEASDVLYGCNQFYVYCFGQREYYGYMDQEYVCPLQRYCQETFFANSSYRPLIKEPAALKVRNWKLIVSSSETSADHHDNFPSRILIDMCKLMYASRPQSLEVLVIPQGIEAMPDDRYWDIQVVLRPLHLLRFQEGNFSIRDATPDEVCTEFHNLTIVSEYVLQLAGTTNLQNELVKLIGSNQPVEYVTDMYSTLLKYARCFERYGPFKSEMGLERWEPMDADDEVRRRFRRHYQLELDNPFRRFHTVWSTREEHPVEEALRLARFDAEREDLAGFKENRGTLLHYLEPQYLRIMTASTNIYNFIKKHKRPCQMFDFDDHPNQCHCDYNTDPDRHLDIDSMAEGIVLLEHYIVAFRRDAPIEVQSQIKKQQRTFDRHYFDSEREELLIKMNQDFEMKDHEHYVDYFKPAFNHMEAQRMDIRSARKELFTFDLANDRLCDIDPELERDDDDLVDWNVYDEDDEVKEN